jgi:hypothetical protein
MSNARVYTSIGFTKYCDLVLVSAKIADVTLNPLQCKSLIK